MRSPHVVFFVLALCLAARTHAESVSLDAVGDNTLYESPTGARSNGIGQHFFAGRTAENDSSLRRGLVRFDAGENLPENATVVSATLFLHLSITSPGTRPVSLHRALNAWGEGTSDAPLMEGVGTAATPGDATWLHRVRPSLFWSAPGGDFTTVPSAVTQVTDVGDYEWSSPELTADVQAWVTQPSIDFGWILIGDERIPSTAKRFDSRENPNPGVRPRLVVEFTTTTDAPDPAARSALRVHPNPFRGGITLQSDHQAPIASRLTVYDTRGRLVREITASGVRSWAWDGRDAHGVEVPAGVYIAQLRTPSAIHRRRIVRLQ